MRKILLTLLGISVITGVLGALGVWTVFAFITPSLGMYDQFYWRPDGTQIALMTRKGVDIRSVPDQALLHHIPDTSSSVTWTPQGLLVVLRAKLDTLEVYRDVTADPIISIPVDWASTLVSNADGTLLAAKRADGDIALWSLATPADPARSLPAAAAQHTEADEYMEQLAFSPDGQWLAALYDTNRVTIWRVGDGTVVQSWPGLDIDARGMAWSPDSQRVVLGNSFLTMYAVTGGPPTSTRATSYNAVLLDVAWLPDGKHILTVSRTLTGGYESGGPYDTHYQACQDAPFFERSAELCIWHVADGALQQAIDPKMEVSSVAFAHDGRSVLAGNRSRVNTIPLQP